MQHSDFPGLYQAADEISGEAQKHFLTALLAIGYCRRDVIHIGALQRYRQHCWPVRWPVRFTWRRKGQNDSGTHLARWPNRLRRSPGVTCPELSLFMRTMTRRKSICWIDMMHVVRQNFGVSGKLNSHMSAQQITNKMKSLRADGFETRLSTYVTHRINDQLSWYSNKANFNALAAKGSFIALIVVNAAALLCALAKIANFGYTHFPTDVLIAIAAALFT